MGFEGKKLCEQIFGDMMMLEVEIREHFHKDQVYAEGVLAGFELCRKVVVSKIEQLEIEHMGDDAE